MDYKKLVAERIKEHVDLELENIEKLIEIPPKPEMGDFAFPCFQLAKVMRKAPNMIAAELAEKINKEGFERVECLGPYLNFFVDKVAFSKNIISKVLEEGDKYGSSKIGEGKNVVVEYSSPNIAKPFHVGHLFTTAIGHSLYRMLNFEGYNPIRINHLGDWGTQFGKLISAYKRWGNEEALEEAPINELLRIYVKFHDEAENNPELEDEGRMYFKKLEDGDQEAVALWERFKDLSLKEFNKIYDMLGVDFDSWAGESFYNDKMDTVVEELEKANILTESNGAKVVMLDEYNMPPCIVVKSDGASIYATRDLAAASYRHKTYNFDKCIYVVGSQQSLHFQQLFKVLELVGFEWAKDMVHVPFGMVALEEGTMSTRKGRVVFLEDVLKQAIEKTKETMLTKNPNALNVDEIAKQVGVGAVVFQELSNSRIKDYTFSWSRTLSFEGETGPYVQYTHARCCAVLRKAEEEVTTDINYELLNDVDSAEVLKVIASFNKTILNAMRKNEPHIITRFVLDLAQAFNKFYHDNSILVEDAELRKARLALVCATRQALENGLKLLGMQAPERM